jgi:hypothetical protein
MLRDVTITKVRALVFDIVNFGLIEGDLHQLSKAYNLDLYHLLNMRDLGWIAYDKKTNTTRCLIKARVNVEELTGILITKYVERKAAAKERSNYYTPPSSYIYPYHQNHQNHQNHFFDKRQKPIAPVAKKTNLLTRLKNFFYGARK